MDRGDFLALALAWTAVPGGRRIADADDADPASSVSVAALRVLLGKGTAQRLDDRSFLFEGRRYRGTFAVLDDGNVVSTVPLEAYLGSVVPREMPRSWPSAALQAQAIVARTYVLQRSNPLRAYDLVPSEADQVYGGVEYETPETDEAVRATAGRVLRYGSDFASAPYSSCCGGHTESSSDAWGGTSVAYLNGRSCSYCTASPWFHWTQSIPLDRVHAAFADRFDGIGELQRVELDPPDASGRVRFVQFIGDLGSLRVKGGDLRRAVGTRTMPSLLLWRAELSDAPDRTSFMVEGAGLGHGVGLCQWGARGLAQAGANAEAIVRYYFPGTTIGRD